MTKTGVFIGLMLAVSVAATNLTGCGLGNGDVYEMREGLTAQTAAEEMGVGINLGNTFEGFSGDDRNGCALSSVLGENRISDYETCWGSMVITRDIIDGMRDSGFNTVRIPVYWGNGMEDDGTFTVRKDLLERVEEVVKWVIQDGMYCVINMHHYDERLVTKLERDEAVNAAKTVWTQVAEHFKDYGDRLIFEGYNEYLGSVKEGTEASDAERFDYCNELNQVFVDAVRATGGNNAERILIASGYNTNIDKTTSDGFILPTDTAENKMMVSVHYIDNNMYWSNQIGSQNWHDYSVAQCELLKERFTDNGIPVFVGECTGNYAGRMASNAEYGSSQDCIRELIRIAREEYGFIPVFWDTNTSDGTSFYSRYLFKVADEFNAETVMLYSKRS